MSALANEVRDQLPEECRESRLRKGKCRVPIPARMKPFLLIDMDHPAAPGGEDARCDFLFIGSSRNLVAPLELKEGSPKASVAVKQLRAGARVAEKLVPNGMTDIEFQPVVVFGGRMNKYQRGVLGREKIKFRRMLRAAALHKCGMPLDQVRGLVKG